MTVVYVDSVFLLNGLMDYFLLLAAARLAGVPPRRGRYLLAALLGGAYAVAVFLPGCGFLAVWPVKLAAGTLLALLAFGGEERFFRMLLLFFGVSCGMAGAVLALGMLAGGGVPQLCGVFYTDVSVRVLIVAATAAYFVFSVVFRASARHGVRGELLPVRLCLHGRVGQLTALWDSGNSLRDPVGGCPVLVVAPGALDALLPAGVRFLVEPERLAHPGEAMELLCRAAPELKPRLLPYRAVGTQGGLLLALVADWAEIAGERMERLTIGLSPTALGTGYSALWGGDVKRKDGRHEQHDQTLLAAAASAAGTSAGGGCPLHWRQRHSAVPAGQEPGSGTFGAFGPGSGPQGTDRT